MPIGTTVWHLRCERVIMACSVTESLLVFVIVCLYCKKAGDSKSSREALAGGYQQWPRQPQIYTFFSFHSELLSSSFKSLCIALRHSHFLVKCHGIFSQRDRRVSSALHAGHKGGAVATDHGRGFTFALGAPGDLDQRGEGLRQQQESARLSAERSIKSYTSDPISFLWLLKWMSRFEISNKLSLTSGNLCLCRIVARAAN